MERSDHAAAREDDGDSRWRKAVCNKTMRKTKNKMAGWRVRRPEKDGDKRMERQSKGSRGLEAYCKGGQGPPRAVAPPKKKRRSDSTFIANTTRLTTVHRFLNVHMVRPLTCNRGDSGTMTCRSVWGLWWQWTGFPPSISVFPRQCHPTKH